MAISTARLFKTGRGPGRPRHTGQTFVWGGSPKRVEQPQKIFVLVSSWTWTSRPMTGSYFGSTSGAIAAASEADFGIRNKDYSIRKERAASEGRPSIFAAESCRNPKFMVSRRRTLARARAVRGTTARPRQSSRTESPHRMRLLPGYSRRKGCPPRSRRQVQQGCADKNLQPPTRPNWSPPKLEHRREVWRRESLPRCRDFAKYARYGR